jgi:hypothetical protein
MQNDSTRELEGKFKTTLDEFFVFYMKDKFKMSKIIKRNTEQMISSIIKYSSVDTRIDLLRKFLGIGEERTRKEILESYLITLKNLPISFYKVFEEGDNNYLMSFDNCMEIYLQKFPLLHLNIESLDRILRCCILIKNEDEISEISLERKRDIFYLNKFYTKNNEAFKLLLNKFKGNNYNEEKDIIIADLIILANREYELNLNFVLDILKRNFKLNGDFVKLESFLNYFLDKYNFKIKITDYMEQSYNSYGIIFNDLDKNLKKIWEIADIKRTGIIFFKDFENAMNVLLGNSENKWKISEYFKYVFI